MKSDAIKQIWIDPAGSICIRPESKTFDKIYRSAMGIDWNDAEVYLYPREKGSWSPTQWFRQILLAVINEYRCELYLTPETSWSNTDEPTKEAIENLKINMHL